MRRMLPILSLMYPLSRLLSGSRSLAILAFCTVVFIPTSAHRVQRSATIDIEFVRVALCEYRGISASFEELSRAYALEAFENSSFKGWESRPSLTNPEVEALVTCRFATEGLKQEGHPSSTSSPDPRRRRLRQQTAGVLEVTWRLNTMAGFGITPHNDLARDALAVFRETVDGFIDRMVFVSDVTALRDGPGSDHQAVKELEAGTVLLFETDEREWSRVRVPSTAVTGWLKSDRLVAVDGGS